MTVEQTAKTEGSGHTVFGYSNQSSTRFAVFLALVTEDPAKMDIYGFGHPLDILDYQQHVGKRFSHPIPGDPLEGIYISPERPTLEHPGVRQDELDAFVLSAAAFVLRDTKE